MIKFPNPIDAVIFDMDGLLLDTERVYVTAIMAAGHAIGVEITEAFCQSMIGIPQKECNVMIQDHFGPAFPMPEYSRQYSAQVKALLEAGVPLKSGAFELVDHVTNSGIPKAIATSSNRATALHHLQKAGLLDRFSILLTRDDVQHGKPNPELYVRAAEALGVEPTRCVAIEIPTTAFGQLMQLARCPSWFRISSCRRRRSELCASALSMTCTQYVKSSTISV